VDPIVPRNQGGSDDLSNLQALCFRCNAGRQALVPQTFFELLQPLLTDGTPQPDQHQHGPR
jgi:5-methylcytosine-specific restriction endonuclease McrA